MIPILLACAGPPVDTAGGDVDSDEQELVPFEYVSTDDDWAYVSVGGLDGVCGVRTDGNLECWGGGSALYWIERVDYGNEWLKVDVALGGACALSARGQVQCWAASEYMPLEADVPSGEFSEVVSADFAACAIDRNDSVTCWGEWGNLWTGVYSSDQLVNPPDGPVIDVALSNDEGCAVRTDGSAECWPASYLAEDWTLDDLAGPFLQIELGTLWGMALYESGVTQCWYWPTAERYEEKCQRPSGAPVAQITLGDGTSCALLAGGEVECWGSEWASSPFGIFTQVDSGMSASCGIRDDGHLVCWGMAYPGEADSVRPP